MERLGGGKGHDRTEDRTGRIRCDLRRACSPDVGGRSLSCTTRRPPRDQLRSALSDIDGIEDAFIYGSWADPSRPFAADIDALVVGDPEVSAVYDAASDVERVVGRPVNVTIRSPAGWAEADGGFERAVRSGARIDLL